MQIDKISRILSQTAGWGAALVEEITTFYAWSRSAVMRNGPTHTWVTSYDCRVHVLATIQDVISQGEYYWYCFGDFHSGAGGDDSQRTTLIGRQTGDLALATCLVKPNAHTATDPAARGTIVYPSATSMGTGVCHQLANQVLYATGGAQAPLTVRGGLYYRLTQARYGDYGRPDTDFFLKAQNCRHRLSLPLPRLVTAMAGDNLDDDFEAHLRDMLRHRPDLIEQLIHLRAGLIRRDEQDPPRTAEDANDRFRRFAGDAEHLLGRTLFFKVFEFHADEQITIVDPMVFASHGRR